MRHLKDQFYSASPEKFKDSFGNWSPAPTDYRIVASGATLQNRKRCRSDTCKQFDTVFLARAGRFRLMDGHPTDHCPVVDWAEAKKFLSVVGREAHYLG